MNDPDSGTCERELMQHYTWLRTVIAARMNGDAASVDDLLNDLASDVLAKSAGWDQVESPAPWLYRLAVRKVAGWRRSQQRTRKMNERLAWDSTKTATVTEIRTLPLEILLRNERHQTVREAMQRLGGQSREVLELKYVLGWSYSQIDEHLGIGAYRIAHRLRRAKQQLRDLLRVHFGE